MSDLFTSIPFHGRLIQEYVKVEFECLLFI
jgi:hypothetical protein